MLKDLLNNNRYEIFIFIVILLSRLFLANFHNSFHSVDSVNFILAVDDFNILEERPHLPGYVLYIALLKFISFFFNNSNTLHIVIQAIFQASSGIILFKIVKATLDKSNQFIFLFFLFTIPTVYFYGIISEIYSIDLLLISIFLLLFHRNKVYYILPFLSLAAGIRQSSGILLIPASVFYIFYEVKSKNLSTKKLTISFSISIIIFLSWFVPLIYDTGGLSIYLKALNQQNEVIENYSFVNNLISFFSYSIFYAVQIILLIAISKKKELLISKKTIAFYLLILIPQILVYTLYHYNKAYALFFIPPILILIFYLREIKIKYIIGISLIQLLFFLFYPAQLPTYNTQVSNKFRNESKAQVWLERLNFWWLPTISANKLNADLHLDIEKNIDTISLILKDKKLLIDNSVILRAKSFAYLCPEIKICEFISKDNYKYVQYDNLYNYNVLNDFKGNYDNFYILVEKEFFENIIGKKQLIIYETKYNYIIKNDLSLINKINL